MDAETKRLVRTRAGNRCEYCRIHEDDLLFAPLQIEHIIPKKHDGTDDEDNLALACADCNEHKGANIAGFDPDTGEVTVLFDPRGMEWDDHFHWDDVTIFGVTAVGRTTVRVLDMNSPDRLDLRRE
jgi:hypothetical protein